MKNLNRKLSVIALSGMAVFGGVAASVVPAFASSGLQVEQQAQDKDDIEKLNSEINNVGFSYRALLGKKFKNRKDAIDAMNSAYGHSSRLNVSSARNGERKLGKILKVFANKGDRVFVLQYNQDWYVIGLENLLKK